MGHILRSALPGGKTWAIFGRGRSANASRRFIGTTCGLRAGHTVLSRDLDPSLRTRRQFGDACPNCLLASIPKPYLTSGVEISTG